MGDKPDKSGGMSRWVAKMLISATLIVAASCGDSSDEQTRISAQGSHQCGTHPYFPPPCWQAVDSGGGCFWYPNYERCADPIDASNPLPFIDQVRFLWAGSNPPLQQLDTRQGYCDEQGQCPSGQVCVGGAPEWTCYVEKLDADRVSVLHGVVEANDEGLPGVWVSVVTDLAYGRVFTEWGSFDSELHPPPSATGAYFIAVNAGAPVRLRFSAAGYLPAERVVHPIAGQYVLVPPVELVPEPTGHTVASDFPGWQVVSGTIEDDGVPRRARLFFPPETTWTPSTGSCAGTASPCASHSTLEVCLNARCDWTGSACEGEPSQCEGWSWSESSCANVGCTWDESAQVSVKEYTVGPSGPSKMPAVLPPASAYTYALEVQAKRLDGVSVSPTFNQPVIAYQENFLGLPVGWTVPSGYYDSSVGRWVQHRDGSAALNGKIIEIVSYTNNAADVVGDTLDLDERQQLYEEYYPATNLELWRVPLKHFSSVDFNFGWGLPGKDPADNDTPPKPDIDVDDPDKPCTTTGSIIECETQVLGEQIPIPGTPHSLAYRSSRVPGYKPARRVGVVLDGAKIHSEAMKATVIFSAGGKKQEYVTNKPAQGPGLGEPIVVRVRVLLGR
jgi:hypothetical protein